MNAGAATVDAVVTDVARWVWDDDARGGMCPDAAIPSGDTLWRWFPECPRTVRFDAHERLQALYGEGCSGWWTRQISGDLAVITFEPEPEFHDVPAVHVDWLAVPIKRRPRHPLAPLVRAWQRRPRSAPANMRDDRIVPSQIAMFDVSEGDARARLFRSPPRATRDQLPLFDAGTYGAEYVTPSLPLVLYELGVGRDVRNRGSGAPLALRLFIEGILAVRLQDRCGDDGRPVALNIPMRSMLARLYPGRMPKPNEWRPLIEAAADALDSREARIDWGGSDLRRVVTMTGLPQRIDDTMRLVVDLPAGAVNGPQVSPRMHLYGPKHGRHYRTLLNLAYQWHEPGRTLVPAKGGGHWLQVDDPRRYRALSDAELVSLVFPGTARRSVRQRAHDARKVIADLKRDGELRLVDGKVLPPKRGPERR